MVYRERNLDGDLELCTAFYYKHPYPSSHVPIDGVVPRLA